MGLISEYIKEAEGQGLGNLSRDAGRDCLESPLVLLMSLFAFKGFGMGEVLRAMSRPTSYTGGSLFNLTLGTASIFSPDPKLSLSFSI